MKSQFRVIHTPRGSARMIARATAQQQETNRLSALRQGVSGAALRAMYINMGLIKPAVGKGRHV